MASSSSGIGPGKSTASASHAHRREGKEGKEREQRIHRAATPNLVAFGSSSSRLNTRPVSRGASRAAAPKKPGQRVQLAPQPGRLHSSQSSRALAGTPASAAASAVPNTSVQLRQQKPDFWEKLPLDLGEMVMNQFLTPQETTALSSSIHSRSVCRHIFSARWYCSPASRAEAEEVAFGGLPRGIVRLIEEYGELAKHDALTNYCLYRFAYRRLEESFSPVELRQVTGFGLHALMRLPTVDLRHGLSVISFEARSKRFPGLQFMLGGTRDAKGKPHPVMKLLRLPYTASETTIQSLRVPHREDLRSGHWTIIVCRPWLVVQRAECAVFSVVEVELQELIAREVHLLETTRPLLDDPTFLNGVQPVHGLW